jgi:BirA family biotin operon repressor/biotin-[acetyl-CoA-carboxylase] ligase
MKLIYLDECASTQKYILNDIEKHRDSLVYTFNQSNGIGSRGNSWIGEEKNLFFSFCIAKSDLVEDLPIQSASIYFSYIFKTILEELGSETYIKWPNDFYIDGKKIGGTITTLKKDFLVCGIGLNTDTSPQNKSDHFSRLDIEVDKHLTLKQYAKYLSKKPLWKDIFNKFSVEFHKQKYDTFTYKSNQKISLQDVTLNDDGSINYLGEKILNSR